MTALPATVPDAISAARAAIAAGDYAEAERLTAHAKAIKALNDVGGETLPRLDMRPAPEAEQAPAPQEIAVKTWFHNRYGELDAGLGQVARELYGDDYKRVAYAKNADFVRYIKTGAHDPRLHRLMLYSPAQLAEAIMTGVDVAALKATQIESQDVLGGLTARFA